MFAYMQGGMRARVIKYLRKEEVSLLLINTQTVESRAVFCLSRIRNKSVQAACWVRKQTGGRGLGQSGKNYVYFDVEPLARKASQIYNNKNSNFR